MLLENNASLRIIPCLSYQDVCPAELVYYYAELLSKTAFTLLTKALHSKISSLFSWGSIVPSHAQE